MGIHTRADLVSSHPTEPGTFFSCVSLGLVKLPCSDAAFLSGIPKSEDVDAIWSHRDLSDKQLPPLHSTLFGAFQVLEFYDSDQATSLDSAPPGDSYVDFGFGSDGSIFSGFQRYSLSRSARVHEKVDADDADNSVVRITFSCVACNPMQDKPIKPDFLFVLHKFYAMLLFREGVGQILHPDNGDQSNPLP
jgi:hypothetical protein